MSEYAKIKIKETMKFISKFIDDESVLKEIKGELVKIHNSGITDYYKLINDTVHSGNKDLKIDPNFDKNK